MDEVGRGTTVKDGFSIAFATTHHLYHINRCRALFATHFHEMVDMLGFSEETSTSTVFPGIKFSCTEIEEDEVSALLCYFSRNLISSSSDVSRTRIE